MVGFLMALSSTALRGVKSVMQELIMSRDPNKLDAVNLLRYSSMMVFAMLAPLAVIYEGSGLWDAIANSTDGTFLVVLMANFTLAALTNFTQFLMTKMTSAITSQVVGNAKSAVLAFVSVLLFRRVKPVHRRRLSSSRVHMPTSTTAPAGTPSPPRA